MSFDLLSVDPARDWAFEEYDSGTTRVVSGRQLREEGFEVVIPKRRDSRLIFYRPVTSGRETVPSDPVT